MTARKAGGKRKALRVGDVMHRGDDLVHPDHDIHELVERMKEAGTAFLPVVDGDEIVGVIESDRIVSRSRRYGERPTEASVRDFMSTHVLFCKEGDDLGTAQALAERDGHRHIVVVDSRRKLAGTLLVDDIEKHLRPHRGAPPGGVDEVVEKRRLHKRGVRRRGHPGRPADYSVKPEVKD